MKRAKMILNLVALCSVISGCIYPFEPDIDKIKENVSNQLVIEGDILVGSLSEFKISRSSSLYVKENNHDNNQYSIWVESEKGDKYVGMYAGSDQFSQKYVVNTLSLDRNMKYRLCVQCTNPEVRNYYSNWSEVLHSAPVDEVIGIADYEDDNVHILVSTHTDINSPYIKWFYEETYEYHSYYSASHYANLFMMSVEKYTLGEPNHSVCYKTDYSDSIMIFDTQNLVGNQLVEYDLYSVSRLDRKISEIYRSTVSQIALSKEAYIYWKTIQQNSQDMGSLFSPQPSEVRGNIFCQEDPSEVVLGYVSVSTVSSNSGFYGNSDFYIRTDNCGDVKMSSADNISYYWKGYRPYGMDMGAVYWAPAKCVDCEYYGGSAYNIPSEWPKKQEVSR